MSQTFINPIVSAIQDRRIAVGLIRRLQLFVEKPQKNNKRTVSNWNLKAFSYRYLSQRGRRHWPNDFDPHVQIAMMALSIANSYDQNSALQYIDHMSRHSGVDMSLVQFAISPETFPLPDRSQLLTSLDYSLFSIDQVDHQHTSRIRQCYENELTRIGVKLPFGTTDMAKINELLTASGKTRTIKLYSELETLIVSFLHKSWPLFSPKALSVSLSYLRQAPMQRKEVHAEHFRLLSRFGLEKLQLRLVLLRAVNGDAAAGQFLQDNPTWNAAQLPSSLEGSIRTYLSGTREFHTLDPQSNHDNPIAVLIQLSMYINSHKGHFDFLSRLLKAYEFDPSIIRFLDWDHLRPQVIAAKQYSSPELIFLAAILRHRDVYSKYEYLENKYGPGGAGADLRKVATYHRAELKQTRARFISTLLKLPRRAALAAFRFLLSPGMIDRIANVFPPEDSLVHPDHKDSLFLALEFRLACLNAMRQKNLISRADWLDLFGESRTALRKLRYDENARAGRLRLNEESVSGEVSLWRQANQELLTSGLQNKASHFALSSNNFRATLLAGDLAEYLVYRNRLAFDLLLANNLRHFFLSNRILSSIREGMSSQFDETPAAKSWLGQIDVLIDDYCKKWITIHRKRSYFAKLKDTLLNDILLLLNGERTGSEFDKLTARGSIESFASLLIDCRNAWRQDINQRVQAEVMKLAEDRSLDQMAADRIRLGVDSAFKETESWIAINQAEYPKSFLLKEQIYFEAIHLKSGKDFQRNLSVEVAKETRRNIMRTTWDIELNSSWIDTIVALVDNLIENACKYSGFRDATPVSFFLVHSQTQIEIIVSNRLKQEEIERTRSRVSVIKSALTCKISEDILRGRGGTGLVRIRDAGSKAGPGTFELVFNEKMLDSGVVEFIATFKAIESELVNVAAKGSRN